MILSLNYVKQANSLEKFPTFPAVVGFTCLLPHCLLCESPTGSYIRLLYPEIANNTEGGLSSTHIPCRQRWKPLNTGYPSTHSNTVTPLNSMGVVI